jgi:hypothetical protein
VGDSRCYRAEEEWECAEMEEAAFGLDLKED